MCACVFHKLDSPAWVPLKVADVAEDVKDQPRWPRRMSGPGGRCSRSEPAIRGRHQSQAPRSSKDEGPPAKKQKSQMSEPAIGGRHQSQAPGSSLGMRSDKPSPQISPSQAIGGRHQSTSASHLSQSTSHWHWQWPSTWPMLCHSRGWCTRSDMTKGPGRPCDTNGSRKAFIPNLNG